MPCGGTCSCGGSRSCDGDGEPCVGTWSCSGEDALDAGAECEAMAPKSEKPPPSPLRSSCQGGKGWGCEWVGVNVITSSQVGYRRVNHQLPLSRLYNLTHRWVATNHTS